MKEEITAAIAAHGMWKQRILDACETGKSEFSPEVVKTDYQCVFGKWLYDSISAKEKASPYYVQVKDLHAQFHKEAARLLEIALNGQGAEAKKATSIGTPYASLSGKLVMLLMKWGNN